MNRTFKRAGLAILLLSLIVLFVRIALTTLEVDSSPQIKDPNKTISKVEEEMKAAAKADADRFKQASEEGQPPPQPQNQELPQPAE